MATASPTILLVEDQRAIMQLFQHELERRGYSVLSAIDADEALHKCFQHAGPIHLLLADVFLPKKSVSTNPRWHHVSINGLELARCLKVLRPSIRVLLISGHPSEDIQSLGGLPQGTAFLKKPFGPDLLLRKIQEVFAEAKPG